jgi:hypothetical protein
MLREKTAMDANEKNLPSKKLSHWHPLPFSSLATHSYGHLSRLQAALIGSIREQAQSTQ